MFLYIIIIFFIIDYLLLKFLYNSDKFDNKDNCTIVSGYWFIKNKHSTNDYNNWFKNTLKINQRYIFFCDYINNDYIRSFRNNYETQFYDYPLSNFYSNIYINNDFKTHNIHVPSIDLAKIWNEKIHLIKLAKDIDTNKTDFYIWVDAGVCIFRDKKPPDKRLNINFNLPNDKLIYSYVEDENHSFSGTVLIIHRDFIDKFHNIYYEYLKICKEKFNDWRYGSDQIIFTNIRNDHPDLFYKISEGYGENLNVLYNYI